MLRFCCTNIIETIDKHRVMHRLFVTYGLVLITCLFPGWARGQSGDVLMAGQRLPLRVNLFPIYQQFESGQVKVSEFSVPVWVYVPLDRNLGITLRTGYAVAGGDGLNTLSGLADVQAEVSYYQPLGDASLAWRLNANLPSGKQKLTLDEFETLTRLSFNQFSFQTPGLGQGLGMSPGLTLAFPVSEQVAAGLGVTYNYRGGFEPIENIVGQYDPGDELLITIGGDLRLTPTASLAANLGYTFYGVDQIGGADVYESGGKTVVQAQYRQFVGFNEIQVNALFRTRSRNSIAAAGGDLVPEEARTWPNQVALLGLYRHRFSEQVTLGTSFRFQQFDETPLFPESESLLSLSVMPVLTLSPTLQVPFRLMYRMGTASGFEIGAGLTAGL